MTSPLRVGLVGAGFVTQHHLAAWSQLGPDARVVAIADPDENAARSRATQYGIEHMFASAAQMLSNDGFKRLRILKTNKP